MCMAWIVLFNLRSYSIVGAKYDVEGKISGTDTYAAKNPDDRVRVTTKITRDRDLRTLPKAGQGKVTEKICAERARVIPRY